MNTKSKKSKITVREVLGSSGRIEKLGYELYKADWMRRITTEQQMKVLRNYFMSNIGQLLKNYSVEEYLMNNNGYNGELYASFDEFLENEYLDEEYMRSLFISEEIIGGYLYSMQRVKEAFESEEATRIEFSVKCKETGLPVDLKELSKEKWASMLMPFDLDGFYLGEEGQLMLADECGNFAYVPCEGKYIVEITVGNTTAVMEW